MFEFQRQAKDLRKSTKTDYRVLIAGVGGAGSNILERYLAQGGSSESTVMFNTDARALRSSPGKKKVQLGESLTHGLGCGGDPELGREAAVAEAGEIRKAVDGADLVFLCAGLGGGTGSGAAPVIARVAKEAGCAVIVFVTLPFHFEGRRRVEQAREALAELRESASVLLTFENDRMGELIVPKGGVQEAFAAADQTICQSIHAITSLLEKPGMIRVGLDELLAVLGGQDARCLFGFGQASGEKRAEKALHQALDNPLWESGERLKETSSVLVHISGNQSVTLAEVETVMEELGEFTDPSAQILFGVSARDDAGDQLCVALISSQDGTALSRPVEKAKPRPEPSSRPEPAATVSPTGEKSEATGSKPDLKPKPAEPAIQRPAAVQTPVPAESSTSKAATPPGEEDDMGAFEETRPLAIPLPPKQPAPASEGLSFDPSFRASKGSTAPKSSSTPSVDDSSPGAPPQPPGGANASAGALQAEEQPVLAPQAPSPSGPPKPKLKSPLPAPPAPAPLPSKPLRAKREAPAGAVSNAAKDATEAAATPAAENGVKIDYGTGNGQKPPSGAQPTITLPQPAPSFTNKEPGAQDPPAGKIVAMPHGSRSPGPGGRGRFENAPPTVVNGEDLDVPTFLRRRGGNGG